MTGATPGVRLDRSHARAAAAVLLAGTVLMFVALELVRLRTLNQLTAEGFTPLERTGMYVHVIPGRLFSIARAKSQFGIVGSAVQAGVTACML